MIRISSIVLLVVVAGCANSEPYHRNDVWYPTGSNAGNLAAMAARPSDLIHGRSGPEGDAHQADLAINHIWLGQPKPLGSGTAPAAASAGGATGAGGAPAPGGAN
jgi:type IV pilus biogenesis protein CpaD/CtpE